MNIIALKSTTGRSGSVDYETIPFIRFEIVKSEMNKLILSYEKVEKAIISFYFNLRDFVASLLICNPDRQQKMQPWERQEMLSYYVVNKFGVGYKNSNLSLSDYLISDEAVQQLPNAKSKCMGLFRQIGKYYDECIDDLSIQECRKNRNFNHEFYALVTTYITHDTMEEISKYTFQINNANTKRKSLESSSSSSSSSSILNTFTAVVAVLRQTPEKKEETATSAFLLEYDRESLFLDNEVCSVLDGPFSEDFSFTNIVSKPIREGSLRYN